MTEKSWTLAKYRSVIRSYALDYVGENALHLDQDSLSDSTVALYAELCRWLRDQGLRYCMLFQRHGTQAKSPEYWLLRGQLIRL
ncbi:CRISPR-associated Csb3 family domain protein [Bifidobacterium animalis subsp. lactis CECT 8145]|nr:CRISPR-associated Csb3 family domain protein [Bifidobacterium animalis subsp. lactis CECT 8145]